MKNIEIKARVHNISDLTEKAKLLSNTNATIIKQNDTFFKIPQGRLKLRKFENGSGELIYYERSDTEGPKLCDYEKSNVTNENFNSLHGVLSRALGIKIIVNKVRQLFLVGQTRIHVDSVENLGNFMELEVVLKDDQSPVEGEMIAHDLMLKLGVNEEDLISGAYADLLNQ